ncbi:hypothetical protein OV079_16945 [Nannocystis pusilla]|uniref:Uncharacterized protein n=1 Tax=Nannocystis pusilla TaxID=889268 RepID=A0A9X3IYT5_9BACT|nr:hypothetical protein [Nannocystis pusilla]MCY1007213.1 hypothetical protein [Nannocystis pusilla]
MASFSADGSATLGLGQRAEGRLAQRPGQAQQQVDVGPVAVQLARHPGRAGRLGRQPAARQQHVGGDLVGAKLPDLALQGPLQRGHEREHQQRAPRPVADVLEDAELPRQRRHAGRRVGEADHLARRRQRPADPGGPRDQEPHRIAGGRARLPVAEDEATARVAGPLREGRRDDQDPHSFSATNT